MTKYTTHSFEWSQADTLQLVEDKVQKQHNGLHNFLAHGEFPDANCRQQAKAMIHECLLSFTDGLLDDCTALLGEAPIIDLPDDAVIYFTEHKIYYNIQSEHLTLLITFDRCVYSLQQAVDSKRIEPDILEGFRKRWRLKVRRWHFMSCLSDTPLKVYKLRNSKRKLLTEKSCKTRIRQKKTKKSGHGTRITTAWSQPVCLHSAVKKLHRKFRGIHSYFERTGLPTTPPGNECWLALEASLTSLTEEIMDDCQDVLGGKPALDLPTASIIDTTTMEIHNSIEKQLLGLNIAYDRCFTALQHAYLSKQITLSQLDVFVNRWNDRVIHWIHHHHLPQPYYDEYKDYKKTLNKARKSRRLAKKQRAAVIDIDATADTAADALSDVPDNTATDTTVEQPAASPLPVVQPRITRNKYTVKVVNNTVLPVNVVPVRKSSE